MVWNSWPSLSLSVTWILVWRRRGLPTCSRSKNSWFYFCSVLSWKSAARRVLRSSAILNKLVTKKTLSSPGGWRGRGGKVRKKRGKHKNQNIHPIRTWLYEVKMPKIKLQVGNNRGHHGLKRPNNHSWGCHNHWAGCLQHEFIHLFWHCNVKKKLQCMFLTSSTAL